MIETKEKKIGESNYSVTQMTARRALRMKARLLRLFGPSLAQMFLPGGDSPMKGMAFSKGDAVKAVESLACGLEDSVFDRLVVDLLSGVRKDGVELTEAIIDHEFAGDLGTLLKLVWFVLEVNFSSFFGESGIGDLFGEAKPLKEASMKRTSTKN